MTSFFNKLNPTNFHLLLFISIMTILMMLYIIRQHHILSKKEVQLSALTDTVTIYKTKEGKNAAYIKVLKGSRQQILNTLDKKSKEYSIIKNTPRINTLVSLKTVTKIDTITKLDTILVYQNDKLVKPDSVFITKSIENPYYTADIKIIKDSLAFSLSVVNDFKIVHKYKSDGWFKPRTLVVDVVNNNPYTVTTGLSSFDIVPEKKSGFKLGLIIGASLVTGFFLIK